MHIKHSKILELSPLGVIICDSDQRIIWNNDRFLTDTGLEKSNVLGQLYVSLPIEVIDKSNHLVQLFDESSDKPKKFSYWQSDYIQSDGSRIHFFTPEQNGLNKPHLMNENNLPKRASWIEFLDYEVSRSRRYENPLSLLKFHVLVNENPESIDEDKIDQSVKDTLMDELRWADMIGNTKQGSYLMVLPETPSSAIEHLQNKISDAIISQLKLISSKLECHVVFGSSHWQKHDDSTQILKRAREELVASLEAFVSNVAIKE